MICYGAGVSFMLALAFRAYSRDVLFGGWIVAGDWLFSTNMSWLLYGRDVFTAQQLTTLYGVTNTIFSLILFKLWRGGLFRMTDEKRPFFAFLFYLYAAHVMINVYSGILHFIDPAKMALQSYTLALSANIVFIVTIFYIAAFAGMRRALIDFKWLREWVLRMAAPKQNSRSELNRSVTPDRP